jgi:NAD(P) transhydrogenase
MSELPEYDLICIGSGPAGQRCAIQAAKLGKKAAVVEKRSFVGGVSLETGTIPSKTLREAVRTFINRRSHDSGLGFAPRVKPTAADLLLRVGEVIQVETRVQTDQMQRNDVNIILGKATFESPHSLLVETKNGSRTLTARNILIAVGTRPAAPPNIRVDGCTIIDSDGIVLMKKLPRTMAVVGAGVIGVEYASMFASMGVEVVVIDKRTRPLEFLDREIVDELVHEMRNMRVTFRLGEAVRGMEVFEEPSRQGRIELESGKYIVTDLILFSIGRQGATSALNLKAAGLETDERGRLQVDDNFRTAVKHIYAAGDVIGFPALAATSAEQGRLAARHMFGVESKPMPSHFPIGIYSIPEISMVGATEEELTEQKISYEVGMARYREIARGHILGVEDGLLKLIFDRDRGDLLGAHAIGNSATELIHIGQAVLRLGGGLEYFLETVFNYPTFAECYKVAALNAANKLRRGNTAV